MDKKYLTWLNTMILEFVQILLYYSYRLIFNDLLVLIFFREFQPAPDVKSLSLDQKTNWFFM